MKSLFVSMIAALAAAGCGGTSTVGTTSAGKSGSTSSGAGGTTSGCIAAGNPDQGDASKCCSGLAEGGTCDANSNGAAGSTGGCKQTGAYDFGDPSSCCSGEADGSGICQAASTGGSGTTTGSPGATAATGSTVGGTCPNNMPDISSGQATVVSGSCSGELGSCPQGFTCVNSKCILNGGNGGLQVTLSFDDPEDFDLHVVEPSGKVIWYSNTNRPVGSSPGCVGSLDRDSNAGCMDGPQGDGVNIENVIYPSDGGIPSGTYKVYVDYYENCDGKPSSNLGVQVRLNGAIYKYCGTLSGNGDGCHTGICGTEVTSFTYP